MRRFIEVPFSFYTRHRWKNAPEQVRFLREFHPHDFQCVATIEVYNSDRELEFYMVREYLDAEVTKKLENQELDLSCEQIADIIHEAVLKKYSKRKMRIRVTEDGRYGSYTEY